jgi:hypothetical protein
MSSDGPLRPPSQFRRAAFAPRPTGVTALGR